MDRVLYFVREFRWLTSLMSISPVGLIARLIHARIILLLPTTGNVLPLPRASHYAIQFITSLWTQDLKIDQKTFSSRTTIRLPICAPGLNLINSHHFPPLRKHSRPATSITTPALNNATTMDINKIQNPVRAKTEDDCSEEKTGESHQVRYTSARQIARLSC